MGDEVELKLALPESAQRAFLKHPLLQRGGQRKSGRLVNLYYDTPDLDLYRHGIALRLRRQGRAWLQTVKCEGRSAAGLTSRPEWEGPYAKDFDFSAVDAADVRRRLERARKALVPLFETNFLRTTWRFEPSPGRSILLVFDRGWIAAAGRREAISELELEIVDGEPADLFSLARALAERVSLVPAPRSKAERGYRLHAGMPADPVRAGNVALHADMPPLAAFRAIALACLDHLAHNHEGAASRDDPEYIHQMRVATRRLRAALRLFAPLLPQGFAEALVPRLREYMKLLGQARDLDVLLAEIAAPVMTELAGEPRLAALVGLITEQRYRHRQAAMQALRSPHFGQLLLLAGDLLHRAPFDPPAADELTLSSFADERMRRLQRKVLRLADAANVDDPVSLHALRIGVKRFRYAAEFFASLFRGRRVQKIHAHLTSLQDTLGQLNDLANAGRLLMEYAGEDARLREAVALVGGWHGPRHAGLLRAVAPGVRRLRKLGRPRLSEPDGSGVGHAKTEGH